MTSGANHQPVHRPVAQHGSHDDSARVSITSPLPMQFVETSGLRIGFTRGRKSSSSLRARRRMEQQEQM